MCLNNTASGNVLLLKFLQVATVVGKDTDYCCSCKSIFLHFLFLLLGPISLSLTTPLL